MTVRKPLVERGGLSGPLAPPPPLALEAVDPAIPPEAERVFPCAQAPGIEVVRDRAANRLGAGHAFSPAHFREPPYLIVREVYDGSHGMCCRA